MAMGTAAARAVRAADLTSLAGCLGRLGHVVSHPSNVLGALFVRSTRGVGEPRGRQVLVPRQPIAISVIVPRCKGG